MWAAEETRARKMPVDGAWLEEQTWNAAYLSVTMNSYSAERACRGSRA